MSHTATPAPAERSDREGHGRVAPRRDDWEGVIVVADAVGRPNPALVAAADRAQATGLLDVDAATVADPAATEALRVELGRRRTSQWWLRPGPSVSPDHVQGLVTATAPATVVLTLPADGSTDDLAPGVAQWHAVADRVLVQVTSRTEAAAAVAAGADGLLASGREAGGRVGATEAFVLLQQLHDIGVPVWLRGGIGLHTGPAAIAGGAAGVVLDAQTGLLKESQLAPAVRQALVAMDGTQTRVVAGHRFYTRPDLPAASFDGTPDEAAVLLGPDLDQHLVPLGQDSALAARLADRFVTVGGLVQALRRAIQEHPALAAEHTPLAPGAGVAAAHGTRHPIAQGPMTRVSDRAEFAAAVAEGGALPFLALALLPGEEVETLLRQTAELVGDRPWGVGLLGFAPADLLAAQLDVVRRVGPPFALVAGGRPSQAADLEAAGISTYLHVPSPGLLERFVKEGARKLVFEGRECGGHVGPLSSHTLWEAQLDRLAELPDVADLQVLLAGGIHDARSAAMASVALAPLAARGAATGVLMGTAYLFTAEAVSAGAIQPTFQQVAVDCATTSLVETAPGHATRCVETDFVRAFESRREELEAQGVPADRRWAELERLNLGRLRMASKGLVRTGPDLEQVDEVRQLAEGMFMIGEVATLRDAVTTVEELHREVSEGSVSALPATASPRLEVADRERPLDIAVVGMASLLPGSTDTDAFWADVLAGRDRITEVPPERWDVDLYHDPAAYEGGANATAGRKTPSKWGGFLDRIGFDPLAYGIPPAALAAVEPVQLLGLEVAARALADAGYARREFDRSRASVVFGAESGNELGGMYGVRAFLPQLLGEVPPELDAWLPALTEDSFPGVLANVIAGRIANRLDLGGVNYTVDAACASSLAALDAGCKELTAGTSDLVLVGGADLHNGLGDYLMFSSVHALSPTGRCRTFDSSADGIALGEGVACLVLKRLADAERDGDRVYAVLDAVAGSSDGRHLGLTAPRKEGQQRAVVRALSRAGHEASDLGLVEAHGTGTVVGDRTEMATLTELFVEAGAAPGSTVLGSVKSQVGHTKCTAGLVGLVKAVKAVHHGVLPPTINLREPNPYYDPATSPFRFLDRPRPWADEVRRAGVSAFGFGGTNFHAVVSSYDAGDPAPFAADHWPVELFLVRGRTLADARRAASDLAEKAAAIAASDPGSQRHRLRDLASTVAAQGSGPVQVAVVAESFDDLATQLSRVAGGTDARHGVFVADADRPAERPCVAFVYPGQGSQRPGMTEELFTTFAGLDDLLRAGERWTDRLFPPAAFTAEQRREQQAAITATDVAQPALGLAAMAITRLLRRAGVEPDLAGGHSYGELAALAAAGSFDEATLLELSAARGESILEAVATSGGDPGTMAAVARSVEEVRELVAQWPTLVVANHNGPRQVVLSGPTDDVHAAVAAWEADGVKATLLPVACAFHSPLIATAGERLAERLAELELRAPAFPVWSNTTAEPYPADDAAVGHLLVEQVTAGVRFVEQVESMYAAGARVFVEAGPGRVLSQQVGRILGDRPHRVVACDAPGESGLRRFLMALGELATLGVDVDPAMLFEGRTERLDLAAVPLAAPGWTVDGAFVRRADGTPLPRSLQPADTIPTLDLTSGSTSGSTRPDGAPMTGQTDPGAVVHEYLRSIRQLVAAERDVMLRYLGAEVPPSAAHDLPHHDLPAHELVPATSVVGEVVAAPAAPVATAASLLAAVQQVVADRTGYPVDMLEPDLDLEADLSIDSIKRLEIVGELADRLGLAALAGGAGPGANSGAGSGADDGVAEELARHKTLRSLVAWLEPRVAGAAPAGGAADATTDPAPASTTNPSAPSYDEAGLMAAVQQVVADRTGYPVDMLEPDLDLEADLSIDSIKRLEIVGELADRLGLAALAGGAGPGANSGADSGADDGVAEELARHKTLRSLVGWLLARLGGPAVSAPPRSRAAQAPAVPETRAPADAVPQLGDASVREVVTEPLGPTVAIGGLDGARTVVVPGHAALTEAVVRAVGERGGEVVRVADTPDALVSALATADVVVDLSPTVEGTDARDVFAHVRPALLGRVTRVLAAGVAVHADGTPTGVPGLFRALARERAEVLLRSVEVDAADLGGDVSPLAVTLVDELLDVDAPASISWVGGQRTTQVVGRARAITPPEGLPDSLRLDPDAVVVLTGGARGITARAAEAIAEQVTCRFVLAGRTPLPGAEDPRLADAHTTPDLRRALLATGEHTTPAAVEAACQRVLAGREIRQTLQRLEALGARVEYAEVDVRSQALGDLLDDVRTRHGRLDVVIHGAGVLDDRLVTDKSADGFDRVFGTKVDGARQVLDRVRTSGIRTVVLFGSVSGVFGNKGQCDYAAANDALDTLARVHDGEAGTRVIALDWGPWAGGGMVSPDLEREYARRGIGLVAPEDGCAALLTAVAGLEDAPQLVVMRGEPEAFAPVVRREVRASGATQVER